MLFGMIRCWIWTMKEASIQGWLEMTETDTERVYLRKQLIQPSHFTQRKWSLRELKQFLPVSLCRLTLPRKSHALSVMHIAYIWARQNFSAFLQRHTSCPIWWEFPLSILLPRKSHVTLLGTGPRVQYISSVKSINK